jgi:hypothetical protein
MYTDPITLRTAELLPVLWDDNYFSLLPGERRTVGATLPLGTAARAGGDDPILVVESLNAALGSVY